MTPLTGRISDIKHFAVHDGPGIRTTVFFKGCPLQCAWCHNPEGISIAPELAYTHQKCIGCGACVAACPTGAHTLSESTHTLDRNLCTLCGACVEACLPGALVLYGKETTVGQLLPEVLADQSFYAQSGGGVTVSGGDPLLQPEFCATFLQACQNEGLHTAVDTSGAVPWKNIERVLPHTDLFLYDIKHIDPDEHLKWTGLENGEVLANLLAIGQAGVPVEVRIPVLPSINDGAILDRIAAFLSQVPSLTTVRLLPYHDFARSKFEAIGLKDTMPHIDKPSPAYMDTLRIAMRKTGLQVAD